MEIKNMTQPENSQGKIPKVAIVYLLWSNEPYRYLEDALKGMCAQTYPHEGIEILMVYNSHKPDEPSAEEFIRETFAKYHDRLPHYTFLFQKSNLGFTGGNNAGMSWARDHGFDYIFLHNGDGFLGPSAMEYFVKTFEEDRTIGAAQALTLLHPDHELINSAGNLYHFLGFGYCDLYRKRKDEVILPTVKDIGYATGASLFFCASIMKEIGLMEDAYYLYHEDTDYSLRMRIMGYRVVLVRDAEFFHHYTFGGRIAKKFFWIERNRYALILVFYTWRTIMLLVPILLALEIGMILFALLRGYWRERLAVYWYWMHPKHWKLWLAKRREVQSMRRVSDKELLRYAVSEILFQEQGMDHPLIKYIGNPLMRMYWRGVKKSL